MIPTRPLAIRNERSIPRGWILMTSSIGISRPARFRSFRLMHSQRASSGARLILASNRIAESGLRCGHFFTCLDQHLISMSPSRTKVIGTQHATSWNCWKHRNQNRPAILESPCFHPNPSSSRWFAQSSGRLLTRARNWRFICDGCFPSRMAAVMSGAR